MVAKENKQEEKPPVIVKPADNVKFKRAKAEDDDILKTPDAPVSQGAVDKALDLAFNPTREKLREVTIIDKTQARLFPILDVINMLWSGAIEVALYRENKELYAKMFKKFGRIKPSEITIPGDELLFRTAQWQKSTGGANLTKITDIALAETETRSNDDADLSGASDAWGKD
jgi:hypothetical protein